MNKEGKPLTAILTTHPPCTVGPMAYHQAGEIIRHYGVRALLIGGEKALAAGYHPLEKALKDSGVKLSVRPFSGEATAKAARDAAESAKSLGAEAVLGMGGGRAIDTAKAAAHHAGLPVMTFPTIPATCAAVTALVVLHQPGNDACDPFLFLDTPPEHVFLHTGILAAAPDMYLRAGIGDSVAKHVESAFKAGEEATLPFGDLLGLSVAAFGYETLLAVGKEALQDVKAGLDSPALRLACELCVINTGLVSLLVRERFNGGLAHALYYALEELPAFKYKLHGEVVAWGSLVQLCLQGKEQKALALGRFLKSLGIPGTLSAFGTSADDPALLARLPQVLDQPDMKEAPYPVDGAMLLKAILKAEALAARAA
ncbi:MAG: iron-containing alcohol dehydrogenase [Eubacteriales bacterium]|nr:iron-containing alcohol dehydrogenase [Eubacteriales bacterium]